MESCLMNLASSHVFYTPPPDSIKSHRPYPAIPLPSDFSGSYYAAMLQLSSPQLVEASCTKRPSLQIVVCTCCVHTEIDKTFELSYLMLLLLSWCVAPTCLLHSNRSATFPNLWAQSHFDRQSGQRPNIIKPVTYYIYGSYKKHQFSLIRG